MLYLGQALLDGVGGPRDLAEAERWLRLAAANRTDPSVRSQALGELRRLGGSR